MKKYVLVGMVGVALGWGVAAKAALTPLFSEDFATNPLDSAWSWSGETATYAPNVWMPGGWIYVSDLTTTVNGGWNKANLTRTLSVPASGDFKVETRQYMDCSNTSQISAMFLSLLDASGQEKVSVGIYDGSINAAFYYPVATMSGSYSWSGDKGIGRDMNATYTIVRSGNTVKVYFYDTECFGGEMDSTITQVQLSFWKDMEGGVVYDFADGWVDYVNVQVPEPASLCMLGLGGLGLIRRKR